MAAFDVVVDEAHRLHEGMGRRRPHEAEAAAPELLRKRRRLGRCGARREFRRIARRRRVALGSEAPEQAGERAFLFDDRERRAGVGDHRPDLAAVPHDAGISEQPFDVPRAEAGEAFDVEPREGAAEGLALSQDGVPGEAGLEALEAELLEQCPVVGGGPAPFGVVVAAVEGVAHAPEAARPAVFAGDQTGTVHVFLLRARTPYPARTGQNTLDTPPAGIRHLRAEAERRRAMADPVTLPVWAKLGAKARELRERHLRELFAADPRRAEDFVFEACGLVVDLSRHRIDREALDLLLELARAQDLEGWRAGMFEGRHINTTEDRAVLHVALRDPDGPPLPVDGEDVRPFVRRELDRMRAFCDGVHAGRIRGATGERFTHVLHIGIGGSELGPRAVCEALRPEADRGIEVRFVANVDPQDLAFALDGLDLARTLVIVASKTFSTQETMLNARAARARLVSALGEAAVGDHFVAVSTRLDRVRAFGIREDRTFGFGDWVGGRFSLWSPVGLPIALFAGFDRFRALLEGAREMDRHFLEAPLGRNLPVLLGLLDVWYGDVLGAESRAVVPYDESLRLLPLHLQQLEMESNGKSVRRDGGPVSCPTGLVVWGSTGTNGQHAYFQLLHQGTRLVPLDILVAAESRVPESDERHLALVANALAQSRALAFGRTAEEARRELEAEGLSGEALEALLPHRVFPGNRPSGVILARRFDARTLGALLALFEHRVFVQGVVWDIDSFDQWGVELGKQMANGLLPVLREGRAHPDIDPATRGLVARVRAWRPA